MPRGAVTAYVRLPASCLDEAIGVLTAASYVAERDDGDPDRPADMVDVYLERHYGMINPDPVIRQRLPEGADRVLDAAGIAHEHRAAGVARGTDFPRSQERAVIDVQTGRPTGFVIRARSAREAAHQLALVAETLGCPLSAITVEARDGSSRRLRVGAGRLTSVGAASQQ